MDPGRWQRLAERFDRALAEPEEAERVTRETIEGVQAMPIDEVSRRKIFADNARRLFRLPV